MEGGKILYFYLKEGEKWKRYRWGRGKMLLANISMAKEGRLVCCGIPEFYWKNKVWEEDRLRDIMGRMLKEQEAEDFYLQPKLTRLAGVEERLPPEALLKKAMDQVSCMEYLVYIGGGGDKRGAWEEEELREERRLLFCLLSPYLARINHFTLVTDRPEGYEEFTDYIKKDLIKNENIRKLNSYTKIVSDAYVDGNYLYVLLFGTGTSGETLSNEILKIELSPVLKKKEINCKFTW